MSMINTNKAMKNETSPTWFPLETAPKNGDDILICLPGGGSDHYYPVAWHDDVDEFDESDVPRWQCRWQPEMVVTQQMLDECHLAPMWQPLSIPPSSICA